MSVSLSASGLTISYHQGVMKGLIKHKIVTPRTLFTGTSGGAVTAMLTKCNICPDKQHRLTKEVFNLVNSEKSLSIAKVFEKYLQENIPIDAADLCNDFVKCAMFKISWPLPHSYMLGNYESKQDVIDATISSCYIPFIIGESLSWHFRGQRHVDGGFKKQNMLIKEQNAIHIASMPKSQLKNFDIQDFTDIYMGLNGTLPFDEATINNNCYAIHEDPDYFCDSLFNLGYADAVHYYNTCFDSQNENYI